MINEEIIFLSMIYALYLSSLFFYICPFLIAEILTRVKKSEASDTWLQSHFSYHASIFWGSIKTVVVALLVLIVLSWRDDSTKTFIQLCLLTPYTAMPLILYRAIKGGMALFENRAVGVAE